MEFIPKFKSQPVDAAVCRERRVMFMPFAVVEGFQEMGSKSQKLRKLPELGFQVCKFDISPHPSISTG